MKNYYIVSKETSYLNFKNIKILNSFDEALSVVNQTEDYTGFKGRGKIIKINEDLEELFSWYY